MNKIEIVGRLTADPILKIKGDKKFLNFRLAETPYKNAEPNFHECVAFDSLAEHIEGTCQKGERIQVRGTVTTRGTEKSVIVKKAALFIPIPHWKPNESNEEPLDEIPQEIPLD